MLHVKDPDRNQVHRVASQMILCLPIPSPSLPNFLFFFLNRYYPFLDISVSLFLIFIYLFDCIGPLLGHVNS